jgi:hypothetical protein
MRGGLRFADVKADFQMTMHSALRGVLDQSRRASLLWVLGAIGLTIFLQLPGALHQDPDPDEHSTIIFVDDMTFDEYLATHRFRNPDHTLLYYLLLLGWSWTIGTAIPGFRILSVLLGLAAIPLTYLIGRHVWNERVGRWGMFLCALSPLLIFYGQTIRPYSLFLTLGLASTYCLLRAMSAGGRRWWIAYAVTTSLVPWVHLAGVVLLPIHALYALVVRGWNVMVPALSMAVPGVFTLLAVASVTMPATHDVFYSGAILGPTLQAILGGQVLTMLIAPPEDVWPWGWIAAIAPNQVGTAGFFAGMFLIAVNGLGILLSAVLIIAARKRLTRLAWANRGLIVATAVVPACLLAGVMWFKQGVPEDRYTIYAWPALYLCVISVITAPRSAILRGTMLALVVGAYAVQAWTLVNFPLREYWNRAVAALEEEAHPEDLALLSMYPGLLTDTDVDTLLPAMMGLAGAPADRPRLICRTLPVLAEAAGCRLAREDLATREVWALVLGLTGAGRIPELEALLDAQGLAYSCRPFQGIMTISLYRIYRATPDSTPACERPAPLSDFADTFSRWRLAELEGISDEATRAALQDMYDKDLRERRGPIDDAFLSLLIGSVDPHVGLALAERALRENAGMPEAVLAQGLAHLLLRDTEKAHRALRAYLDGPYEPMSEIVRPILEPLLNGDHDGAVVACRRSIAIGCPAPLSLQLSLGVRAVADLDAGSDYFEGR